MRDRRGVLSGSGVRRRRARAAGAADVRRAGVPGPRRRRRHRARPGLPGQSPPRHHRSLVGRPHADARRLGPLVDRLQRRGLQLRRAAARAGGAGAPVPFPHRYRGRPPRLHGVGRALHHPLRRDVRLRHLGSAERQPRAGSRPLRHQAPLLRARRRASGVRLRDQGAAAGDGLRRAGPPPPRGVVPLPQRGRVRHRYAPRGRFPGPPRHGGGARRRSGHDPSGIQRGRAGGSGRVPPLLGGESRSRGPGDRAGPGRGGAAPAHQ